MKDNVLIGLKRKLKLTHKTKFQVEDLVMTSKEKAEHLAEFIVVNFHHCPIDENKCVEDCIWWKEENCKDCLLKNTEHIKIRSE